MFKSFGSLLEKRFQLNTIQRITETTLDDKAEIRVNVSIKHYPTNN